MEREDIDEKAPHIIAGSYQILQQIGSGGGGIVYLGRHLRLDKSRPKNTKNCKG